MDDLISRQSVINVVNDVANCRPYKVVGKRETYSEYNEGWTDGLNRLEANINALPSAQPERKTDKSCDGCAFVGCYETDFPCADMRGEKK